MRISRLRISGFRSIKDVDINIPQMCALVGPNNAGKSNILLAIQKVLGRDWVSVSSFGEDDVWQRDGDSGFRIAISFEPAIEYRKFKGGDPAGVRTLVYEYTRYKAGERAGERRLEQACLNDDDDSIVVLAKAPKKGEQHKYQPLVGIPAEIRDEVPLVYIGTSRSLHDQLPKARYSMLKQLLEDVDRDLRRPDRVVELLQPGGEKVTVSRIDRFSQLMEEVLLLLRTDEFKALESSIKTNALRMLGFDPETESDKLDFFFSPFSTMDFYRSLDLLVREGDFTINATELGEGTQNALVLALLRAFEERRKKGAVLLLEEPEMFLHPQMQRSLYKTLFEIAKTNQVIYTTHSPHFVAVPDYTRVALVRKGDIGTAVRFSNLPTNDKRREKLVKELDPERNELFFARRLLLVEGSRSWRFQSTHEDSVSTWTMPAHPLWKSEGSGIFWSSP